MRSSLQAMLVPSSASMDGWVHHGWMGCVVHEGGAYVLLRSCNLHRIQQTFVSLCLSKNLNPSSLRKARISLTHCAHLVKRPTHLDLPILLRLQPRMILQGTNTQRSVSQLCHSLTQANGDIRTKNRAMTGLSWTTCARTAQRTTP